MPKLLQIFLINLVLELSSSLRCGGQTINHCEKCGVNENSEKCAKCEDTHFLFNHDLLCISCDNLYLGDVGCEKNCYHNENNALLCEENSCKEGYYNINGVCWPCSHGSKNCTKCEYKIIPGRESEGKIFKCLNCSYKDDFIWEYDGQCHNCLQEFKFYNYFFTGNCSVCIPKENRIFCDACIDGYYRTDYNTCTICVPEVEIRGGICQGVCSNKPPNLNNSKICYCKKGFVPKKEGINFTCIYCGEHCKTCELNGNNTICKKCDDGYFLAENNTCIKCYDKVPIYGGWCETVCSYIEPNLNNSKTCYCKEGFVQKKEDTKFECIYCGEHCMTCVLNGNNTICKKCFPGYILYNDKCYECSEGCLKCKFVNDEEICLECKPRYFCECTDPCDSCTHCTPCPAHCIKCSPADKCEICEEGYILINGTCVSCGSLPELGVDKDGKGLCKYCKYSSEKPDKIVCTECVSFATLAEDKCIIYDFPNCLKANVVVTKENLLSYICVICRINNYFEYNFMYTKTLDYKDNKIKCELPVDEFQDCVTGTQYDGGNRNCTTCYSNYPLVLNEVTKIAACNSKCNLGWFNRNKYCYKCSDSVQGNEGCDDDYGCSFYSSNNKLQCEKCKDGYFHYEDKICLPCNAGYEGCMKCHFNERHICDKCYEDTYFLRDGNCILIVFTLYKSEITSGCLISNKNYDYYMNALKCEKCDTNFNKTEDETCVYCHARKNGGPMCSKCENKTFKCMPGSCDTSKKTNAINSQNQCFNCKDELGEHCEQCEFINDNLRCIKCDSNSMINTITGRCIVNKSLYKKILYCKTHVYTSDGISVTTKCEECKEGYYLNENGNCIELILEKCSLQEIFNKTNNNDLEKSCKRLCEKNNYVIIDNVNSIKFNEQDEIYLCLSNSGSGKNKLSPKNLRKCSHAEYYPINETYICTQCQNGFELDLETNLCKQKLNIKSKIKPGSENCIGFENININDTLYSCTGCENGYVPAEIENGAKICVDYDEVSGCVRFTTNTYYINNAYNCTSCISEGFTPYALYNSAYLGKTICLGVLEEILNQTDLNYNIIISSENGKKNEGKCYDSYFTIDEINNEYCYSCKDENIGMKGCDGTCTFSNKRVNVIECESNKCKKGYIETTKGVCEPCDTVNEGCLECHYSEEYPKNYEGIKRKRRFVCDSCDVGYLPTDINTCEHCAYFGFDNCKHCVADSENNNEYKCEKCEEGYFLNDDGNCQTCTGLQVKGNSNKCIECDDTDEGGIQGCLKCVNDNDNILCLKCDDGFILSESKGECINKLYDTRLYELANCLEVEKVIDKYKCIKCIEGYILLIENGKRMCVTPEFLIFTDATDNTRCQEAENIKKISDDSKYTAEDQPFYSCKKCLYNYDGIYYTLLTDKNSQNEGHCVDPKKDEFSELVNCTKGNVEKINGKNVYNCEECIEDNELRFSEDTETNVCRHKNLTKYCTVKYCQTCKRSNNYFCSVCALSDYEVSVAGSCIKKTKKVPAITPKDIYRLELNQFKLRALTASEISYDHVFLVYLVFKYKETPNNRNRHRVLNEKIEAETYCTVVDSKDENLDNVKIVEYNCVADSVGVNLTETEISNVISNTSFSKLKVSNFEEVVEKTDFTNLEKKTNTNFTFEELFKYVTFRIDDGSKIQTSNGNEFDITFNGTINKDVEIKNKEVKLKLVEIENETMDCTFNTKENNEADLHCKYNIKKHKNVKSLSFKTFDVYDEKNPIYFAGIDEVELYRGTKKKTNVLLYVLVSCAVIVVAAASFLIYFFLIKKRKKQPSQHKRDIKNVPVKEKKQDILAEKPIIYEERVMGSHEKFKVRTEKSIYNNYMK